MRGSLWFGPKRKAGALIRKVQSVPGLTSARCDAVFEASQELAAGDSNVNPIVNVFRDEQFEEKKATFFGMAPVAEINGLSISSPGCVPLLPSGGSM